MFRQAMVAKVNELNLLKETISLSMRWVHKMIDAFVAVLLHYVLRYRLKVIRDNLNKSFIYPGKKALNRDVRANYHFLAKILRQTLVVPGKGLLRRRMHLSSFPLFDEWLAEGKSVIVTFGHIGNWEWTGSYLGVEYPDQVCALYKKIKSRGVNALMHRRRLSHVNYLIEIKQMGELLRLMQQKPLLILMISDQNPGSAKGMIWTSFLGQKTAFVSGPENLALRYKLPVVYVNSSPRPDGGYDLTCQKLYDGMETVAPGEIMQRYANCLEENIVANRSHWLWSHKRWKRTRPA